MCLGDPALAVGLPVAALARFCTRLPSKVGELKWSPSPRAATTEALLGLVARFPPRAARDKVGIGQPSEGRRRGFCCCVLQPLSERDGPLPCRLVAVHDLLVIRRPD